MENSGREQINKSVRLTLQKIKSDYESQPSNKHRFINQFKEVITSVFRYRTISSKNTKSSKLNT